MKELFELFLGKEISDKEYEKMVSEEEERKIREERERYKEEIENIEKEEEDKEYIKMKTKGTFLEGMDCFVDEEGRVGKVFRDGDFVKIGGEEIEISSYDEIVLYIT